MMGTGMKMMSYTAKEIDQITKWDKTHKCSLRHYTKAIHLHQQVLGQ
jgi:hypothetical protein